MPEAVPDKPGRGKYERTLAIRAAQSKRQTRHGLSHTPTHELWTAIIQWCTNPKNINYRWYGGRGTAVCDRWMKFDDFLADMGEKPEGMILGRADRKGNFEPGNCAWQPRQQADLERRREKSRQRYRRRVEEDPEYSRWVHMKQRHGLDREAFEAMVAAQDGRCYLCGDLLELDTPRRVHMDHDHSCCHRDQGKLCGSCTRGLSCEQCNKGIGCFDDDPERMRRVVDNLEAANQRIRAARAA
jgi:hypothetical protein